MPIDEHHLTRDALNLITKKELYELCQRLKIKGRSGKTKSELIDLLVKDSNQKKQAAFSKVDTEQNQHDQKAEPDKETSEKKPKRPFLNTFNVVAGLASILGFVAVFISCPPPSRFQIDKEDAFKRTENGYHILILPFAPLENCTNRDTEIEQALKKRLLEMSEARGLGLQVKYYQGAKCPHTYEEGREIGRLFKADLVIWGDYYEKCTSDSLTACLKYALVQKAPVGVKEKGGGDKPEQLDLEEVREGKLQKDIDFIIYWTLGLREFEQKKYMQAVGYFKVVEEIGNGWLSFYLGYSQHKLWDLKEAINNYDKAIERGLETRAVYLNRGDAHIKMGNTAQGMSDYQASLSIAQKLAEQDPNNAEWQRDLSVSHDRVGDVRVARGDRAGGLESYQASLSIREKLAEQDPNNAEWQRDLSVSHERVGDVRVARGDRAGGLESYQASLSIREKLAEQDPNNAEWQRDLSVSHDRVGDVRVARGDRAGGLESYQASLSIREKLAEQDPNNAEWQRDLSVSFNKVGDVRVARGDRAGGLESYQASLSIREKLAEQDPNNAEWQRDLSVSHERVGDVRVARGDRAGALESYQASLSIREKLAEQDPNNAEWQRDLSVSYLKLGRFYLDQDEDLAIDYLKRCRDTIQNSKDRGFHLDPAMLKTLEMLQKALPK